MSCGAGVGIVRGHGPSPLVIGSAAPASFDRASSGATVTC